MASKLSSPIVDSVILTADCAIDVLLSLESDIVILGGKMTILVFRARIRLSCLLILISSIAVEMFKNNNRASGKTDAKKVFRYT